MRLGIGRTFLVATQLSAFACSGIQPRSSSAGATGGNGPPGASGGAAGTPEPALSALSLSPPHADIQLTLDPASGALAGG